MKYNQLSEKALSIIVGILFVLLVLLGFCFANFPRIVESGKETCKAEVVENIVRHSLLGA